VVGNRRITLTALILFALLIPTWVLGRQIAAAATPANGTLTGPSGTGSAQITWTGGPLVGTILTTSPCQAPTCDSYSFNFNAPSDYWQTHTGSVNVSIQWVDSSQDLDLYLFDSSGNQIASSTNSAPETSESVDLGKLTPGIYTVEATAGVVTQPENYTGTASINSVFVPPSMVFSEDKSTIMKMLTVDYPLNVIFVGYHPSAAEVSDLGYWTPEDYQPTVAQKSSSGDEVQNTGAGLLNWNKNHLITSKPYFVGIRYNYKLHVIQASDDYAKALFQVAKDNTAQGQSYHSSTRPTGMANYDSTFGKYRLLAKGGDPTYKVSDPTKTDLIDAYAVEDWIFNSRFDPQWACAFRDLETQQCYSPSIMNPDPNAYHDNYYDKFGLNIDKIPQGVNKGSSVLFLDTFTAPYARDYFRPSAYHTWGTDEVYNGAIRPWPIEDCTSHPEGCGSWRITDPDTHAWRGVDFARTWGGRYRFHFFDLGAAPNDYESATWAGEGRGMSSDYPMGDPPIWQYKADPQWQQQGDNCAADPSVANYTGGTPCRMMPRLGRDVGYDLFFRSTAGYLYRPLPKGDVNWLAVSQWTDFYSHPQWVNGQATNAPWYGTWWTDPTKLYNAQNVLRWLSAAEPYVRWVGLPGQQVQIYDPKTNQPTGQVLDTSPKYEDLPAPNYHVMVTATGGTQVVPEPLYPGDNNHVIKQYGSSKVDLTNLSIALEKAKAAGNEVTNLIYDGAVNPGVMRDYIDANRPGIADVVPGVNTIPAINMVFEKAYTWALPLIVGGVAYQTKDGEAWGVMNDVNDRFGWSGAHFPACQTTDPPGTRCSMTSASTPQQDSGTGFSYTIEHEAAHNLGLSHPHDGSFGVDRCTQGPNAGKWECYWSGLGWVMDISAAPTTYAMDYHPYEVEDQDNLQRGRTAEYLVKAQDSLRQRLTDEAAAGRTSPSAAWSLDYSRMKNWRLEASALFACGDYLHAEYAARNGSLAAQGYAQTAANTVDSKLLNPGQLYFFNVHPECPYQAQPDLAAMGLSTANSLPHRTVITATVTNVGLAPASKVVVGFQDGTNSIGTSAPIASIAPNSSASVTFTWDTRGLSGNHTITATVDPANVIAETDKTNNTAQTVVAVSGNLVPNGSFESHPPGGTAPDSWTGSPHGTLYDTTGKYATDGKAAVGTTANGLTRTSPIPTWMSVPVTVTPGRTYNLGVTLRGIGLSSAPSVTVTYLDSSGKTLSAATGIATTLKGTFAARELDSQVTAPAGASAARLTLNGFATNDTKRAGTAWFDDVWLDY
jgi:hypothetical protein